MRVIVLGLVIWMASVSGGAAQTTYDGCKDINGVPVASVSRPYLGDMAKAGIDPMSGVPVILYDPTVLPWVSRQTRLFVYAHECGHHALGHALGGTHPMLREQAADCWGIRELVRA